MNKQLAGFGKMTFRPSRTKSRNTSSVFHFHVVLCSGKRPSDFLRPVGAAARWAQCCVAFRWTPIGGCSLKTCCHKCIFVELKKTGVVLLPPLAPLPSTSRQPEALDDLKPDFPSERLSSCAIPQTIITANVSWPSVLEGGGGLIRSITPSQQRTRACEEVKGKDTD